MLSDLTRSCALRENDGASNIKLKLETKTGRNNLLRILNIRLLGFDFVFVIIVTATNA